VQAHLNVIFVTEAMVVQGAMPKTAHVMHVRNEAIGQDHEHAKPKEIPLRMQ
jgi:hypothetical protein